MRSILFRIRTHGMASETRSAGLFSLFLLAGTAGCSDPLPALEAPELGAHQGAEAPETIALGKLDPDERKLLLQNGYHAGCVHYLDQPHLGQD